MKRLISLLTLAFSVVVIGLLLVAPLTVLAQDGGPLPRVGRLRAVVTEIAHAVSVLVFLVGIRYERTVVQSVAHPVTVGIHHGPFVSIEYVRRIVDLAIA